SQPFPAGHPSFGRIPSPGGELRQRADATSSFLTHGEHDQSTERVKSGPLTTRTKRELGLPSPNRPKRGPPARGVSTRQSCHAPKGAAAGLFVEALGRAWRSGSGTSLRFF